MKTPLLIVILIVIGILGFMIVYSQTGIPEKGADAHAVAGGYGGGATPRAVDYETIGVLAIICLAILLSGSIKKVIGGKK